MVTVARLESAHLQRSRFAPASVHLVFFVLSSSETGFLLVVKLGRNVVMVSAGVKIIHQSNERRPLNYQLKKMTRIRGHAIIAMPTMQYIL